MTTYNFIISYIQIGLTHSNLTAHGPLRSFSWLEKELFVKYYTSQFCVTKKADDVERAMQSECQTTQWQSSIIRKQGLKDVGITKYEGLS